MNQIIKFALVVNKYPNIIDHHVEFDSWNCLNNNRDFDWGYECSKTSWINSCIDTAIEQGWKNGRFKKALKYALKKRPISFYEVHYVMARNLIKKIKRKRSIKK